MLDQNSLSTMDLSLQHSAMVSIAASFWKRPNIQAQLRTLIIRYNRFKGGPRFEDEEELKRYFEIFGEVTRPADYKEERNKFFKNITEELKSLNLPGLLISDLLHVTIFLGLKIMNWYENLSLEFQFLPISDMRNIHVTCFGELDEAKTFDMESLKSDFLMIRKPNKILKELEYYIACCFIQKNYLKQHGSEIIKTYQEYSNCQQYVGNSRSHLILCSALFFGGHDSFLRRIIGEYSCSIELYMFELALYHCSDIAIRY